MLIWQKMLVVEAVRGSASFPDTEMQRLEGCQQLDVEKKRGIYHKMHPRERNNKKERFYHKKAVCTAKFRRSILPHLVVCDAF